MKYAVVTKEDEASIQMGYLVKKKINLEYDEENPDIVIAIGGDGTTLRTMHKYEKIVDKIIIFSIHTGHLGFFSSYEVDELALMMHQIHTKEYKYDEYHLLNYKITTEGGHVKEGLALNEVTIINPTRTLLLDVHIDGEYFELFRGTGLCLSTPSGSTGYNKSLQGSVLSTKLNAFQMTEIASINSNLYHTLAAPFVLSSDEKVELVSAHNKEVWITVDSMYVSYNDFKSLEITISDKTVKLAHQGVPHLERIKKNFIETK